ncbi:hypothetical protein [Romboutsia sp.]|uniref:hypothetical protein n=1 Tax=Romboutsia sp. TaxID=1965302 RepID=UPI002B6B538A|nr:hypothetical protein [Romboutsia sp.]HSQ89133.1 hypothetical protein [Romboutsia sp.]
METLFVDGKKITTKEELHKYLKNKLEKEYNIKLDDINEQDFYRGKKHKKPEPQGPKQVYLKYMFPYKIELNSGCKQMIFGVLVDAHGHPIRNAMVEFELSDYDLGTMTFSPAISFSDGCFFTNFIAECPGSGCVKLTAVGTNLNKVIPINVYCNNCY